MSYIASISTETFTDPTAQLMFYKYLDSLQKDKKVIEKINLLKVTTDFLTTTTQQLSKKVNAVVIDPEALERSLRTTDWFLSRRADLTVGHIFFLTLNVKFKFLVDKILNFVA